jgi:hypothetical protein
MSCVTGIFRRLPLPSLERETAEFYKLGRLIRRWLEAMMATVVVYNYTVFDQGKLIRLPSKRTADKIAQIGGQVIWETAQSVDESELRDDGRYLPKQAKDDEGEQAAE